MADQQSNSRTSSDQHRTPEPFTDPQPSKGGVRQTAAKVIAFPLAAAGGAVAEVSRKFKEFITGQSTQIDTSHKALKDDTPK
ncbi:hypothetical protein EC968_004835 [Mortierella alpina]|nr:hypothetical protein EC968_004835 [Mortierella alpina]